MAFTKEEKISVPVKLMLQGFAGTGKTWQALRCAGVWAKGNWDDVYFLDTENNAANLYRKFFGNFNHSNIAFPATSQKICDEITLAENLGAKVIILDSYSDSWQFLQNRMQILGNNEVLETGNMKYTSMQKNHEMVLNCIKYSSANFIITAKQSEEKQINKDGKLKSIPMKVTKANDLDYHLSCVIQLDKSNLGLTQKDRTGVLPKSGKYTITDEMFQGIFDFCGGSAGNFHPDRKRLSDILSNPKAAANIEKVLRKFNSFHLGSPELDAYLTLCETSLSKEDATK